MSEENICPTCPTCHATLPPDAAGGLCPACLLRRAMAGNTAGFTESGEQSLRWDPPAAGEMAAHFPQLEILELLGRGGMGAVYKVRQNQLDRIAALKILPPHFNSEAFANRFAREAKALAKLNHPNIVTLYEFGRTEAGLYFFLMEYVDGANLRRLMEVGRVEPREALAIVPQVCDALQYAHDSGIVHRDIKPENILLDRHGRVKVADFGLAKLIGQEDAQASAAAGPGEAELTQAGVTVGTPQYMAPEQVSRPADVDHRADIYALGVVLYQMLTGELPGGKIEPPSRKVTIDVRLDEVVLRALEREPSRRYGQASVMKADVETVAGDSSPASVLPYGPDQDALPPVIEARRRLTPPAIGLMIGGALNLLLLVVLLDDGVTWATVAAVGTGALVIFGARRMMQVKSYGLCVATAILGMIVPPGLLLGLPFGIWALIVLSRREVRQAFGGNGPVAVPAPSGDQGGAGNAGGDSSAPGSSRSSPTALDYVAIACLVTAALGTPAWMALSGWQSPAPLLVGCLALLLALGIGIGRWGRGYLVACLILIVGFGAALMVRL